MSSMSSYLSYFLIKNSKNIDPSLDNKGEYKKILYDLFYKYYINIHTNTKIELHEGDLKYFYGFSLKKGCYLLRKNLENIYKNIFYEISYKEKNSEEIYKYTIKIDLEEYKINIINKNEGYILFPKDIKEKDFFSYHFKGRYNKIFPFLNITLKDSVLSTYIAINNKVSNLNLEIKLIKEDKNNDIVFFSFKLL